MEFPNAPKAHLRFLSVIRSNKAIEQKPFILFGPPFEDKIVKIITAAGATVYLPQPLDLKQLFDSIRGLISRHTQTKYKTTGKNQLTKEEYAALYDKSKGKQEKLEIMLCHIDKLLAFPATVASILNVTQNERSGAAELSNVLKSDPAVSAEVLRVANSVYYARGGEKRILDVKDAVVRIGFVETKNIAMSLSVFQAFTEKNYATGFNHNEFWFHCLATAAISELLAKNSRLAPPEEAFICGLLHDLGTLLLNEYFNDLFLALIEKTTSEGMCFLHLQNDVLGFNHNDLMAQLFLKWNFPESFCNDLLFLCCPQALSEDFLIQRPLPAIVSIAQVIAKSYQIGREADCCVDSISNETFERLRMPLGIQAAFVDKIYNQMNIFNNLLKIFKGTFPVEKKLITNAGKINILCHSFRREVFSPVIEYLKVQGYKVSLTADIKDFAEKGNVYHAFLLTDGHGAVMGDIKEIARQSVLVFSEKNEEDGGDKNISPSKMIVFDAKNDLTISVSNENVVVSRYPIDLRNLDFVISCLLLEKSKDLRLNAYGAFKPNSSIANDVQGRERRILVAHFKSKVRGKIGEILKDRKPIMVDETDDGQKAVNLARTSAGEYVLVIVQLNLALLMAAEVVRRIKELPNHKRAKYLVYIDASTTKEQLIPLVKLGVRDFIREDVPDQELLQKLSGLGVA
jgi:HD-like signal output (HDOD) protein/DNA-binding response OmpR family regulator